MSTPKRTRLGEDKDEYGEAYPYWMNQSFDPSKDITLKKISHFSSLARFINTFFTPIDEMFAGFMTYEKYYGTPSTREKTKYELEDDCLFRGPDEERFIFRTFFDADSEDGTMVGPFFRDVLNINAYMKPNNTYYFLLEYPGVILGINVDRLAVRGRDLIACIDIPEKHFEERGKYISKKISIYTKSISIVSGRQGNSIYSRDLSRRGGSEIKLSYILADKPPNATIYAAVLMEDGGFFLFNGPCHVRQDGSVLIIAKMSEDRIVVFTAIKQPYGYADDDGEISQKTIYMEDVSSFKAIYQRVGPATYYGRPEVIRNFTGRKDMVFIDVREYCKIPEIFREDGIYYEFPEVFPYDEFDNKILYPNELHPRQFPYDS